MGGKPNPGTPKDKRLSENQPKPRPAAKKTQQPQQRKGKR